MTNSAHERLIRRHTVAWIHKRKVLNEKKKRLSFRTHFFLFEIFADTSKKIAVMKGAQEGLSTWAIATELHDARYKAINQIHVLPSSGDATVFVQSKVNPMIQENPDLATKASKKDADSVEQKQFGRSFLFYKGTRGKTSGHMITSDRNWYDEYDRCEMEKVHEYESRLEGIGSLREERWLSTPTIPEYGIHAKFLEGDQKHWRFRCPECLAEQHMQWPESVDKARRCYVCLACNAPITKRAIREGKWKAKFPGREISSYWIPQMIVPWISAGSLIDAEAKAEQNGTLDYFYNFKLGLPYLRADGTMPATLVLKNLVTGQLAERNACAGVDVQQDELYVQVGNADAVFAITKLRDEPGKTRWDRLGELIELYDIRYMVIDAGYKPNDVLAFAKRYPGIVYMNWYQEAPKGDPIFRFADAVGFQEKGPETFEESIKVLTDRERALDLYVDKLRKGERRFHYAAHDPNLQELIRHMKTMYTRTIETKHGTPKREWANTGKNDYVMAGVYLEVAFHKQAVYEGA